MSQQRRFPLSISEKSIPTKNSNKLVFARLNINSIVNKFELLSDQIKGNINVLMISETKINDNFPFGNFFTDGFRS